VRAYSGHCLTWTGKLGTMDIANLKKMGIKSELWLNDSVKGTELPTSCIALSKHEKEFCGFLKNVKVPSGYSMSVLKTYFISRSKSSSRREV
jgi:hypothetical protein